MNGSTRERMQQMGTAFQGRLLAWQHAPPQPPTLQRQKAPAGYDAAADLPREAIHARGREEMDLGRGEVGMASTEGISYDRLPAAPPSSPAR